MVTPCVARGWGSDGMGETDAVGSLMAQGDTGMAHGWDPSGMGGHGHGIGQDPPTAQETPQSAGTGPHAAQDKPDMAQGDPGMAQGQDPDGTGGHGHGRGMGHCMGQK